MYRHAFEETRQEKTAEVEMDRLEELKQRLGAVMSERNKKHTHNQEELEERMAHLDARRLRFAQLAPELFETVIEPRLRLFAECIEDSQYARSPRETRGVVSMNRHRRYAADVHLEVLLSCDSQVEHVVVAYQLRIIPILMEFEREDVLTLPLEEAAQETLEAFLDTKLESTMRSYLELTENPYYQKENLVVDPVCGMTFHRDEIVDSVEYQGRTIHFCARTCKERFEQSPEEFAASF